MRFNFNDIKESIKIKNDRLLIKCMVLSGKEGDHFITVSPTLMVSGYGSTAKEADESFQENMRLFCDDILKVSQSDRNTYLKSLGFVQEKFHRKNFSKTYVDTNGVLQGFDEGTVKTSLLETV